VARLSETAYLFIKDMLLDSEAAVGEQLSAEDLADRLGMSRQPTMDALKRLESEGFLEIIPQVGCRVVKPAVADVKDFFRLMAAVEGEMASLAARRRTPEHIAELHGLNRLLRPFSRRKRWSKLDLRTYRTINRDFHDCIHLSACSSAVSHFARIMWDRTDFYISAVYTTEDFRARVQSSHFEHESLIAAIEKGDDAEASKLMRAHVFGAGETAAAGPDVS